MAGSARGCGWREGGDRAAQRRALPGVRGLLATCSCLWLVACGAGATGTSGAIALPKDTAGGLPGFDGFSVDASAAEVSDAADLLDANDASASDASASDTAPATDAEADDALDAADGLDAIGLACSHTCEIDDDCNSAATNACSATTCKLGCCTATITTGDPCDDGIPCNGPDTCKNGMCAPALPAGCDDGLTCTVDSCDGTDCHHDLTTGWCQIGATCVQAEASIPGDPCKICNPQQNPTDWSQLPGCCKADADCPALGACDKPTCDVDAGKCLIVKIPGCCKADADCDDGNACTTDACDMASGNCQSSAVTCQAPSECESATCNPATGQCEAVLQPGWCRIDDQCFATAAANPANPCQTCEPLFAPQAWTAQSGIACTDNDSCTFSDVCTSAGVCKGTKQPGCCSKDADCATGAPPCKTGVCNTKVGLCTLTDQPGCCTSGVCCDTASQQFLPTGSPCGSVTIGSEYQCVGNDVQQRELVAGCTGVSATTCTNSLATGAAGPWNTISTCPPGTQCLPIGSNLQPACQMLGSCAGACGGTSAQGCGCSADCLGAGTCCPDLSSLCGCSAGACCDVAAGSVLAKGTPCGGVNDAVQFQCAGNVLQKRTGQGKCAGSSACSLAVADVIWGGWQDVQACPAGCSASADGSSGSCIQLTGSCLGSCGAQAADGNCSCKTSCKASGTCCSDYGQFNCDYAQACGVQANSCAGACGGPSNSSGCWCDASCASIGDCCPDKLVCGCTP